MPNLSISDNILLQVTRAFQECFPDDAIDLESDFFDLGGNSLTLVSLCASLEAKMGFQIPPSKLLYYPTVEELVAEIDALSGASGDLNKSN